MDEPVRDADWYAAEAERFTAQAVRWAKVAAVFAGIAVLCEVARAVGLG